MNNQTNQNEVKTITSPALYIHPVEMMVLALPVYLVPIVAIALHIFGY